MQRRRLLLSLSSLFAAAMPSFARAHAARTGRIDGRIVLSPAEPVSRVGRPNERGIPGRVRITNQTGETVAVVSSDPDGRFRIDLPLGQYTLHLERRPGPGRAPDRHVAVQADKTTKVVIPYDAGIR